MKQNNTFKELKQIALKELIQEARERKDRELYFKLRKKYRSLFPKINKEVENGKEFGSE
ncbi:MAG: hypothetical protein ABIA78_01330 [archaeon]